MAEEKTAQEEKTSQEEEHEKNADVQKMSDTERKEYTDDLLRAKRAANAEAKDVRAELEALQAKNAEQDKKKKEDELSAQELVKTRDVEIETLKTTIARDKLVAKATGELAEAGFKPNLITIGLPEDLNDDNYAENIKAFKSKFKEYVATNNKPDPKKNSLSTTHPKENPPKREHDKSLAGKAIEQMKEQTGN